MHLHSCGELGSVAFDLFLWGEKDRICAFEGKEKNKQKKKHGMQGTFQVCHRKSIYLRGAARLKIGKLQTTVLELIAMILRERKKTPETPKFALLSCFHTSVTVILVWSSCQLILFWHISACLQLSNRTESQSFSSPT